MARRRDILKLAAVPAFLPLASGASKIPNAVLDAAGAPVQHLDFGDQRVYFDGATDQLGSLTIGSLALKPGREPHPPHQHPEEEIMTVASGSGEILAGGKWSPVGPGSIMYCAGNSLHGVRNTGSVPMLFYYSKWKA